MSAVRWMSVAKAAPLVAAALAVGVACGGPSGQDAGRDGSAAGTVVPRTAPNFSLPNLDGKAVRLSDSAGKVRLVDFWATWCAPCREEIPSFKELYAQYKDQGFELIAISMDDEGATVVRPFVEKARIPYTNLIGNEAVSDAFGGILGYPSAFFIDRDGKIVASFVGGVPKKVLEDRIREMLGLAPTS
ncbi:MAG: TlpA family protein disulfide reductase [Acidobacteriia bacterium]|nr:TlpA family protein disulfide reductase [Terriglobia bacterium]